MSIYYMEGESLFGIGLHLIKSASAMEDLLYTILVQNYDCTVTF